jgi:hypothetical protein
MELGDRPSPGEPVFWAILVSGGFGILGPSSLLFFLSLPLLPDPFQQLTLGGSAESPHTSCSLIWLRSFRSHHCFPFNARAGFARLCDQPTRHLTSTRPSLLPSLAWHTPTNECLPARVRPRGMTLVGPPDLRSPAGVSWMFSPLSTTLCHANQIARLPGSTNRGLERRNETVTTNVRMTPGSDLCIFS